MSMPRATPGLWSGDSLRGGLVRRLVTALTLIGIFGATVAYLLGEHYANLSYDDALGDDVVTLAAQVDTGADGRPRVNLTPSARRWLLANEGERVLYRVVDLADGRVLEGNGDLGPWPGRLEADAGTVFRDTRADGTAFRVGSVVRQQAPGSHRVLIEVAETLGQRQTAANWILGGSALLFGLTIAVAVLVVRSSIDSALAPLDLLAAEAAQRSGANLTPLDPALAPSEVRGLIVAINRMMERLDDAIAVQSRFIANAAHQLRTPVAGLRLQAQLALEEPASAEVHARLGEIDDSAARAAHLIEQLLTLSRAESGAAALSFRPVDLVDTAAQVVQRHLPAAAAKGIDLGCSGAEADVRVLGNELLLAEMLGNLVDNAVRYGRRRGTVTIALSVRGHEVELQVSDDGPGIAPAEAQALFRRFQRGDVASAAGVGAGLGLAIVREIAERHGGSAECLARPGSGAVFAVRLPRWAAVS